MLNHEKWLLIGRIHPYCLVRRIRVREIVSPYKMPDALQSFVQHHALLGLAHGAWWRGYFDEGEAAFERLADLVEVVAVEAVERADDAKIARQGQFGASAIVSRHAQNAAVAVAERGQCLSERDIDGRAVELVDDQPEAAKFAPAPIAGGARGVDADALAAPRLRVAGVACPVFADGLGEIAVLDAIDDLPVDAQWSQPADQRAHAPLVGGCDELRCVGGGRALPIAFLLAPEDFGDQPRQFGLAGARRPREDDVPCE